MKLYVFDLAGTTVNQTFGVHDSMITAFQSQGMQIDRQIASMAIAVPKPVGISRILAHLEVPEDEIPPLKSDIHQQFLLDIDRFYAESPLIAETPGTIELFQRLRSMGIKIGIDTGFDRQTADTIFKRLGWIEQGLIDASVTSDEVSQGRPQPDMIFELMRKVGVSSEDDVVKVGDTPADIKQGRIAGCAYVFAVNSGAFPVEALQAEGPDLIVDSLNELPKFFNWD
ncbi:HAD-IA family hydrolase [Pontibacter sp. G13]|uniref:HAD-IA family hydrolase n=1 Tax=Pontibacter sp. G13 TaxID=3074898 RepID=UPI00288A3290|nr:HAD-IA family hydrolase [Pontibacter sp. G13]WNJ19861.1 HAD-IA family hydrolase [Pontibacter sp. G13]